MLKYFPLFIFLFTFCLDFTYIGVDFALKVINWDPDTLIRLQLWDIAGTNIYLVFYFMTKLEKNLLEV